MASSKPTCASESNRLLYEDLHLARENPAVADWLFGDHDNVFPVQRNLLSPADFEHVIVLTFDQAWNPINSSHTSRSTPNSSSLPTRQTETSLKIMYVPKHSADGIFFGYIFMFSSAAPSPAPAVAADVFRHGRVQKGRFACHANRISHLVVIQEYRGEHHALLCSEKQGVARKSRIYVLPRKKYTPTSIPTTVLDLIHADDRQSGTAVSIIKPPKSVRRFPNALSSTRAAMLAADFTQSIKGPSEVVDGIWDRDQIKNLPACVLEDINISDDPDQRALSSLPVPLNTSWLRAEDLASLDQYRQRQDEELEGTNVLFKMSAVGQPRIAQKRKKMRLAAPTNDTELRVVTKERSADEAYWSWNGACVPSDLHKATSSVRNDQKRGVRLVEQLQRGLHMHGDFESSFVTQDTYDPLSGMIQSRSSSSVITRGTVLTGRTRSLFCHLGANLYYANVLWVTTDQTLVYSVEKALYDSASSATHGAFCTCSIDDEDCYD